MSWRVEHDVAQVELHDFIGVVDGMRLNSRLIKMLQDFTGEVSPHNLDALFHSEINVLNSELAPGIISGYHSISNLVRKKYVLLEMSSN